MPRRDYRSGSLYQRCSDGRWVAAVRINHQRHARYFKTEREARRWLNQRPGDGAVDVSRQKLGDYLEDWLAHRTPELEPNSLIVYQAAINRLAPLHATELERLRPAAIERLLRDLAARYAPATVSKTRSVLNAALRDAVRLEILPSNPVQATRVPRQAGATARLQVWDGAQVQQFLQVAAGDRLEALWQLLLTLGCRGGEARALKWSDVDLERRRLVVARSLSGDCRHEGPTKTKQTRVLPLSPLLLAALRRHRSRQLEERLQAGPTWQDSGRLFTTPDGRALSRWVLVARFEQLTKAAGLPRIRVHDCRHTAATWLLSRGVSIAAVGRILGHATPAMTFSVYAHVLPDDLSGALRAMDQLLSLAPESHNQAENQ